MSVPPNAELVVVMTEEEQFGTVIYQRLADGGVPLAKKLMFELVHHFANAHRMNAAMFLKELTEYFESKAPPNMVHPEGYAPEPKPPVLRVLEDTQT